MEYKMPQSVAMIYTHIIFSTKNRINFLNNEKIRTRTHAYLASTLKSLDSSPIIIGGTADHVHILCAISKNHSLAEIVRELKRSSSKWIKALETPVKDFQWQSGYGAFSVSLGYLSRVRSYIANQGKHHEKRSFEEEFRDILRRLGIAIDDKYLWD
jgi:putative transposase